MRRFIGTLSIMTALTAMAVTPVFAQGGPASSAHWDANRAMQQLQDLVRLTPRSVNTPGHARAIDYLLKNLANDPDVTVKRQDWSELREDGVVLHLSNIVARLHPMRVNRVLFGSHYDSIIAAYKDADPKLRTAPMPGANNSASGVAVLLESARVLSHASGLGVGVDFVFFDGEEGPLSLGAGDPHWHALGSPYFAAHIESFYAGRRPQVAVILDMVGKRSLKLQPEADSLQSARSQVQSLWQIGHSIAAEVFVDGPPIGPIGDDQVALARLGIPSLLLIDFDYSPWFNTTHDTPDKCSPDSLSAVGRTLVAFAQTYAER
ncbi:MAG TPA: M28 family peptidase [Steroidobacteraceae bacterium]|jgi:Zn-dependent M28 family amino/carboxypeptidase